MTVSTIRIDTKTGIVPFDKIKMAQKPAFRKLPHKSVTTERQTIEGSAGAVLLQAITSYYKLLHSCHQYLKYVGLS